MKKLIKVILGTILIPIIALLIFNLFAVRSIKTEIVIDAPAEKVWVILMNHQAYPDWNPFIIKISGSTQVGGNLAATIQSEGNDPMDFTPTVLVNNKNEEFRWVGKLGIKGIFDGEHYFILEQIGPDQTRFIHGENFTGLFSGLLLKMILEDTEAGFNSMNEALKSLTEK